MMRIATYQNRRATKSVLNGQEVDFNLSILARDWDCDEQDIVIYDFDGSSDDLPFTVISGGVLIVDQEFKDETLKSALISSAQERIDDYATNAMRSVMESDVNQLTTAVSHIQELRGSLLQFVKDNSDDADVVEAEIQKVLTDAENRLGQLI